MAGTLGPADEAETRPPGATPPRAGAGEVPGGRLCPTLTLLPTGCSVFASRGLEFQLIFLRFSVFVCKMETTYSPLRCYSEAERECRESRWPLVGARQMGK